LALEHYFEHPSIDALSELFDAVNTMDISLIPDFTPMERRILRFADKIDVFENKFNDMEEHRTQEDGKKTFITLGASKANKDRKYYEAAVVYQKVRIPIRVPLTMYPEEIGDFSLIKLVLTFTVHHTTFSHPTDPQLFTGGAHTHPIILLLNALFAQKRIIFMGHGKPSGEVSNYVLAACGLGSGSGGVLRGFSERAFPYTNLINVEELLTVPGYVAGVTNSIFESHPDWWDVMLDINTGKITVSGQTKGTPKINVKLEDYRETYDYEFMTDVMAAIHAHYGEHAIRAKFEAYVMRFVHLAALYEQRTLGEAVIGFPLPDPMFHKKTIRGYGSILFPDEASETRELDVNKSRIEAWRTTTSFAYYRDDFSRFVETRAISGMNIERDLALLKQLKNMPAEQVNKMYASLLQHVVTDDQIIEFLSYLPLSQGGLQPIALGILHSSRSVRDFTVEFMERIQSHTVGKQYVAHVNRFLRLAFERLGHLY
jgi:hypothetical protein